MGEPESSQSKGDSGSEGARADCGGSVKVDHAHVRILRERLSKIHSVSPPSIKLAIVSALTAYARAVAPYCLHVEESWVEKKERYVCLDCLRERVDWGE